MSTRLFLALIMTWLPVSLAQAAMMQYGQSPASQAILHCQAGLTADTGVVGISADVHHQHGQHAHGQPRQACQDGEHQEHGNCHDLGLCCLSIGTAPTGIPALFPADFSFAMAELALELSYLQNQPEHPPKV